MAAAATFAAAISQLLTIIFSLLLSPVEAAVFTVVNSCRFSATVEFTGQEGLYLFPGQSVQAIGGAGWSGRISLDPAPSTSAEFTVDKNGTDTMGISLVDGFNVGIGITYGGGGCIRNGSQAPSAMECHIGLEQCPRAYCIRERCVSPYKDQKSEYSSAVKSVCPNAYSLSKDKLTSLFTCNTGGDYKVALNLL